MRKFLSLLVGMSIGTMIGALLVIFFSPVASDEFQSNLQSHYQRALKSGREASARRRKELEEELHELHQQ